MRNPEFNALRDAMLAAGVAPRHATRTTHELRDHYDDLVQERLANGEQVAAARNHAAEALGEMDDIVAAMSARRSSARLIAGLHLMRVPSSSYRDSSNQRWCTQTSAVMRLS